MVKLTKSQVVDQSLAAADFPYLRVDDLHITARVTSLVTSLLSASFQMTPILPCVFLQLTLSVWLLCPFSLCACQQPIDTKHENPNLPNMWTMTLLHICVIPTLNPIGDAQFYHPIQPPSPWNVLFDIRVSIYHLGVVGTGMIVFWWCIRGNMLVT